MLDRPKSIEFSKNIVVFSCGFSIVSALIPPGITVGSFVSVIIPMFLLAVLCYNFYNGCYWSAVLYSLLSILGLIFILSYDYEVYENNIKLNNSRIIKCVLIHISILLNVIVCYFLNTSPSTNWLKSTKSRQKYKDKRSSSNDQREYSDKDNVYKEEYNLSGEEREARWKTEEAKWLAEAEKAKQKAEEARRRAEQERQRREEEEARRKAEQERQRREEEEARRKAEQERIRKEQEEARRRAEQERIRREQEEAKRRAEQERIRREQEEARRRAEQERQRRERQQSSEQTEKDAIFGLIKDAFDAFELPYDATFADVKKKRVFLLKFFHPDHHYEDKEAERFATEKARKINEAYEILKMFFEAKDR